MVYSLANINTLQTSLREQKWVKPSLSSLQCQLVLPCARMMVPQAKPDIALSVNKLAQFMQRPIATHLATLKRLLRYLKGTIFHGLMLQTPTSSSLIAYSDADCAENKDDFTSTSAHLVYYGSSLISWKSSKQRAIARSSTEAEYRALANSTTELSWVQSLLTELGVTTSTAPSLFCDNLSATYLTHNPVYHSRMKHISIDIHFVRDLVQQGKLKVLSCLYSWLACRLSHQASIKGSPSALTKQDWCRRRDSNLAWAC